MKEDLLQYYGDRAPEYDRIYQKPERQPDLAAMRSWLAERVADKKVLEVACGTGYWTAVMAETASQILATDASAPPLSIARIRLQNAAHINFAVKDLYALEQAEQKDFDVVFGGFIWSHIPQSELSAFYLALLAPLRAGGQLILMDNLFVEGSSTPLSRQDEDENTYQQRKLDSGKTYEVMKNFPQWPLNIQEQPTEATLWDHYWAIQLPPKDIAF